MAKWDLVDLMRVHRHDDGSVALYAVEPMIRPEACSLTVPLTRWLWPFFLNPAEFPKLRREPLEMAENNYPNVKA